MNILVVTPELPWPPETGGKASQFATLKALETDHSFRLVITRASPQLNTLAAELEAALPHVRVIRGQTESAPKEQIRTRPSWLQWGKDQLRSIKRAFRADDQGAPAQPSNPTRPYYPFVPICSEALVAISEHLAWADLIQAEFHESLYIAFLPITTIPKIFICHQAHARFCERFYHSRATADLLAKTDCMAALVLETQCMKRFSRIITFTQEDRDALLSEEASLSIRVSPFPIPADCETIAPNAVQKWPLDIVYVGSGVWHPNVEAVRWFLQEVYPLLRLELPVADCCLHVIGHWPEDLRQTFPEGEVQFHGFTSQMADVLPGNISINPVFTGAGLRTKLLAAAACSSPMVSTSIGCEGLGLQHEHHALLADSPADFATAITTLKHSKSKAKALAENAFLHVHSTFSAEAVRDKRNQIYASVCQEFARK